MILNGDFELRGIESKVSKNNNAYYVFHLEDSSGASNNAVARQPYDIVGLKKVICYIVFLTVVSENIRNVT